MLEAKDRMTFRFTAEQKAQYKKNPSYYLSKIRELLEPIPAVKGEG